MIGQPDLHTLVAHLGPLVGTWRGAGSGSYPTIESFSYVEEVTFGHVGKPFLAYGQKTRHAETSLPLHAESGYLRPVAANRLEFVLAHPTGILESLTGTVETNSRGLVLDLHSTSVTGTATSVSVTAVVRRFELVADVLSYKVAMAAVGEPLTHHLAGTLHKST